MNRNLFMGVFIIITLLFVGSAPAQGENLELQKGLASWYSPSLVGARTASGEPYVPTKLTAAHRTLPFGTYVSVTNLHNNKSVVVRINDRGPFIQGRVIDLSQTAANQIGMTRQGIAQVKVDLYPNQSVLASQTRTTINSQPQTFPSDPLVLLGLARELSTQFYYFSWQITR